MNIDFAFIVLNSTQENKKLETCFLSAVSSFPVNNIFFTLLEPF